MLFGQSATSGVSSAGELDRHFVVRSTHELRSDPRRPTFIPPPQRDATACDSFQFVLSSVLELNARPCNQILHGGRNQNLARSGQGRYSLPDVNGDPSDVWPRRSISPVWSPARISSPRRAPPSRMAAQRIARAGPSKVARKPSPVALISRPLKRASCRRTMASCASNRSPQDRSPEHAARSGFHNVGEQNGGEHPVVVGLDAVAGQKLLDLTQNLLGILLPGVVVGSQAPRVSPRKSGPPRSDRS